MKELVEKRYIIIFEHRPMTGGVFVQQHHFMTTFSQSQRKSPLKTCTITTNWIRATP